MVDFEILCGIPFVAEREGDAWGGGGGGVDRLTWERAPGGGAGGGRAGRNVICM